MRSEDLALYNEVLNSASVTGYLVGESSKVRALVQACGALLESADGLRENGPRLSAEQFAAVGLNTVQSPAAVSLLDDLIDGLGRDKVDSYVELQTLADRVLRVTAGAAGGTGASLEDLQALGLEGLTPDNIDGNLARIAATADDGHEVDSLAELQALLDIARRRRRPTSQASRTT